MVKLTLEQGRRHRTVVVGGDQVANGGELACCPLDLELGCLPYRLHLVVRRYRREQYAVVVHDRHWAEEPSARNRGARFPHLRYSASFCDFVSANPWGMSIVLSFALTNTPMLGLL